MYSKERTLLIVEDEPSLHLQFKLHCSLAIREVHQQLEELFQLLPSHGLYNQTMLSVDSPILSAYNYPDAENKILDNPYLDFISVDLRLDQANNKEEPKGMALLKKLRDLKMQTLAIVASAENDIMRPMDALQKYKAIHYFKKPVDGNEYRNLIKAVLWYLEAADHLARIERYEEDADNLTIASRALMFAGEIIAGDPGRGIPPIELNFPEPLDLKIKSIERTMTYGSFHLTGDWIKDIIKTRILKRDNWGIIEVAVRNFSSFRSLYASQVDELLKYIANLLKGSARQFNYHNAFVGVLGQEYTPEARCILIVDESDLSILDDMVHWIDKEFEDQRMSFLPRHDRAAIARKEKSDTSPTIVIIPWSSQRNEDRDCFPDVPGAIDTLAAPLAQDSQPEHGQHVA
jgi:hypothetical protein